MTPVSFLLISDVVADGGEVIQPPGFNMIFLPYADDVRNLKFDPTPIATDELIVDAKKIVEKLTVKSLSVDTRTHFTSHNGAGREGENLNYGVEWSFTLRTAVGVSTSIPAQFQSDDQQSRIAASLSRDPGYRAAGGGTSVSTAVTARGGA